jgi:type III restriction enzyme
MVEPRGDGAQTTSIDNPILSSPYAQPDRHYEVGQNGPTGVIKDGRRPSESWIPIAVAKKGKKGEPVQETIDFDITGERRERNDLESADEVGFARDFETWWTGRQRGTRYAEVARDLRNDAAHDVYEKAPDGPRWRMRLGNRQPIFLDEFTNGYVGELDELEFLIARAEQLAGAAAVR